MALKGKIRSLPDKPGIYQFLDISGEIIYVGKAKSLKKRVASYFNKTNFENRKTALLVRKIVDVATTIVANEYEALLLENSLVKEHQPRYNIQLKDDKTFPWICIKKERFPRIFSTRTVVRDGSTYFGPYASLKMMKTILDLVYSLYPIRNCNYVLSKENVEKK
jgi:excinuclease ABC subunit C